MPSIDFEKAGEVCVCASAGVRLSAALPVAVRSILASLWAASFACECACWSRRAGWARKQVCQPGLAVRASPKTLAKPITPAFHLVRHHWKLMCTCVGACTCISERMSSLVTSHALVSHIDAAPHGPHQPWYASCCMRMQHRGAHEHGCMSGASCAPQCAACGQAMACLAPVCACHHQCAVAAGASSQTSGSGPRVGALGTDSVPSHCPRLCVWQRMQHSVRIARQHVRKLAAPHALRHDVQCWSSHALVAPLH